MYEREWLRFCIKGIGAWLLMETFYSSIGLLPLGMQGLSWEGIFIWALLAANLIMSIIAIAAAGLLARWLWPSRAEECSDNAAVLAPWFHLLLAVGGVLILCDALVRLTEELSPASFIAGQGGGSTSMIVFLSVQILLGSCFLFGWGFRREFGEWY